MDDDKRVTSLGMPAADRVLLFGGLPLLVLAVGFGLPPLARWALDWGTALPFRFVFRLVGGIDRPWEIAVNVGFWLAAAFGVAVTAWREALKITLTDAMIMTHKDDRKWSVPRSDVASVFLDGKCLVVLDRESRQLIRDVHEASPGTLAAAFRRHGYPWRETDPYADRYRRWTVGSPDLPPAVNDVLAARGTALKRKARQEARDLHHAIENLGYAVRDEGTRQYWRPLVKS